jgi:flagellar motor protein MotB
MNDSSRRVGRSQAASIFWGLVSVFFAAAACYYFWKNHQDESNANVLRDQVLTLQEQRDTLSSQKDELQSNIGDAQAQLKTREDFLNEKETKLAQEESDLDARGAQSQGPSQQGQAAVIKRFNDAVRKLVKDADTDVVVRGGRPVLRVPSSIFFAYGDATLKPGGKAELNQIAQALDGELGNFELRVETFTDGSGEVPDTTDTTPPPLAPPPDKDKIDAAKSPTANPVYATGWDLTGARAGALAHYLHDQTPLPFQNGLVVPRGDTAPIVPSGKESHARNRRIEITITPLPAPTRPTDAAHTGDDSGGKSGPTEQLDISGAPKSDATPKKKSTDAATPAKSTEKTVKAKKEK